MRSWRSRSRRMQAMKAKRSWTKAATRAKRSRKATSSRSLFRRSTYLWRERAGLPAATITSHLKSGTTCSSLCNTIPSSSKTSINRMINLSTAQNLMNQNLFQDRCCLPYSPKLSSVESDMMHFVFEKSVFSVYLPLNGSISELKFKVADLNRALRGRDSQYLQ